MSLNEKHSGGIGLREAKKVFQVLIPNMQVWNTTAQLMLQLTSKQKLHLRKDSLISYRNTYKSSWLVTMKTVKPVQICYPSVFHFTNPKNFFGFGTEL